MEKVWIIFIFKVTKNKILYNILILKNKLSNFNPKN